MYPFVFKSLVEFWMWQFISGQSHSIDQSIWHTNYVRDCLFSLSSVSYRNFVCKTNSLRWIAKKKVWAWGLRTWVPKNRYFPRYVNFSQLRNRKIGKQARSTAEKLTYIEAHQAASAPKKTTSSYLNLRKFIAHLSSHFSLQSSSRSWKITVLTTPRIQRFYHPVTFSFKSNIRVFFFV